jgi:hypothetical protein
MDRTNKIAAIVAFSIFGVAALVTVLLLATSKSDGKPPIWAIGPTTANAIVGKPTSFTATVTMSVSLDTYSRCESGGYGDIRTGAQVEIVNEKNEVLAVGTLTKSSTSTCDFSASIKSVPVGEKMYGAKLGNANRGVIWKSETEARGAGWALSLGG